MENPSHAPTEANADAQRRPFLKGLLAGGLVGSLIAGGVGAFANGEYHSHFWKSGGCGHRHAMRDPAVLKERAGFMAERMLDTVGATDDQRTRVKSVLQATIDDLIQLRSQHDENRKAIMTALTQSAVDRAELSRIRIAELQLADRASERVVTSLADIAEVLTPEQRTQLAGMLARWPQRHRDR